MLTLAAVNYKQVICPNFDCPFCPFCPMGIIKKPSISGVTPSYGRFYI